jgi:DNA-binding response OmpR family regulator
MIGAMPGAAGATHLLLVDPDPLLQEMVESGLRLFNPSFVVHKAEDPAAALALLRRFKIEVLITELDFPPASRGGIELLLELERLLPQLPVIVLTETPLDALRDLLRARAFLAKPPDMDSLLHKVHQLVQESRESILRGISLESFLQVLEVEKKTCTLTITAGHRVGRLYVHDGLLIHAETENSESKAAAFAMLSWPDYSIRIVEKCDATPTITDRLNAILMEWCVNKDHGLLAGEPF